VYALLSFFSLLSPHFSLFRVVSADRFQFSSLPSLFPIKHIINQFQKRNTRSLLRDCASRFQLLSFIHGECNKGRVYFLVRNTYSFIHSFILILISSFTITTASLVSL
jgi:hypothetical protein